MFWIAQIPNRDVVQTTEIDGKLYYQQSKQEDQIPRSHLEGQQIPTHPEIND